MTDFAAFPEVYNMQTFHCN